MNDPRNVIDHFKYWKTEAILADLDTRRHNFSIFCSNLVNDFNISTIVRNANAFLAKQVIIYGNKRFDRRGAVGTHHYSHITHLKTFENVKSFLTSNDIQVVGVDNIKEAEDLNDFVFDFDRHTILCFGQENTGLPEEIIKMCEHLIYIPQFGSVRSLNVGTASGIVMNDWTRKWGKYRW